MPPRPRPALAWLAPAALLGAVAGGVALVRAGEVAWFALVLVPLAVVPAAWVLVSALSPARADRRCPACGRPAVERTAPDALHGLACRSCGWQDPGASAWLLAEDDAAPLERMVLAQRAPERAGTAGGGVDARRGTS